jgi:hypothetical protein
VRVIGEPFNDKICARINEESERLFWFANMLKYNTHQKHKQKRSSALSFNVETTRET